MRRPPRAPTEPLFGARMIGLSILQGLVVLGILLAIYGVSLRTGRAPDVARAMTFTALVVANLALILTNRSWSRPIRMTLGVRNVALWWVIGGAGLLLSLVLCLPPLRALFGFGAVNAGEVAACVGAGLLSVAWFEAYKVIGRRGDGTPHRGRDHS